MNDVGLQERLYT